MRIYNALHCPCCSETRLRDGKPVMLNMVWLWLDRVISVAWGDANSDTSRVTLFVCVRSPPQSRHKNEHSKMIKLREGWSPKLHDAIEVKNIVWTPDVFDFLPQRNFRTACGCTPHCPHLFGVFNLVTTTAASSCFPRRWFPQVGWRLSTCVRWVMYTA